MRGGSHQWRFGILTVAAVLCSGCGGAKGPELGTVTGTITLDGKPLPNVNIQFAPEATGGAPSYGGTNAEGEYKLMFAQNRPGAMLGKHRVELTAREPKTDEDGKPVGPQDVVTIPAKYQKKDALTAEVKAGSNTIDFKLDSQPEAGGKK
jgi:hypothetical protein